jgi:hypothetical protein
MVAHKIILTKNVNRYLEIDVYKFKRVKTSKSIDTVITQYNEIQDEIKARIQANNRYYFGSRKMFKSRMLSKSLRCNYSNYIET